MTRTFATNPARRQSWGVALRFLAFGSLNYLVGNVIFTGYWWALRDAIPYWTVALVTTVTTSIFSYFTHTFGTLRSRKFNGRNLAIYAGLQTLTLVLFSVSVPRLSRSLGVHLLYVQYVVSAIFSILSLLALRALNNRTQRQP